MGYTHYFDVDREAGEREWNRVWPEIVADAKLIVAEAERRGIAIAAGSGDDAGEPILDGNTIWLNGCGNDAHETFVLTRLPGHSWDSFCKTARKPYNLVVAAILIRAAQRAPRAITVKSDGRWDSEEWQAARQLVGELFGGDPEQMLPR